MLIVVAAWVAALFGRTLEDGVYFKAFGPIVYVVFFGGMAYAFYEFTKVLIYRSRYITYRDGILHILEQCSVSTDQIVSVRIERFFLLKNLVIRTHGGRTIRVRGYMIQRDLNEVRSSIEMLR